jgi:transposase-like protein
LAQELGSVSKACKQAGMDRTSFYEWKRRFQTHGLEGLKDLPPVHKSHPQTTPEHIQERIVQLALSNPTRGCNYLAAHLAQQGVAVSFVTVQNILNKQGLAAATNAYLLWKRRPLITRLN